MENQKPRNPINANPRTTVIYSDLYPNTKGKIIRQFPTSGMVDCYFKDVGFVKVHANDLIAFKDDGELMPVKGDVHGGVHGNGAGSNRLANWLKAKSRKRRQAETATNERAQWAEPMKAPAKSNAKTASKIIDSNKSEDEKHYLLRMKLTKDSGVSDKKGSKVRVNAEQVQK